MQSGGTLNESVGKLCKTLFIYKLDASFNEINVTDFWKLIKKRKHSRNDYPEKDNSSTSRYDLNRMYSADLLFFYWY